MCSVSDWMGTHLLLAVTKSGIGKWGLGCHDTYLGCRTHILGCGTWEHGDMGLRDERTWRHGDVGLQNGDAGMQHLYMGT